MKVPKDIISYVRKKKIVSIVKFLILTTFATLIFIVFGNRIFLDWLQNIKYIFYLMLIVYFAFKTKVIRYVFDKTYQGTILRLKIKETKVSTQPDYANWDYVFTQYTFYAWVALDNGKIKKKKLKAIPIKNRINADDFLVGDRVIHIAGTEFCNVIRAGKESKTCVVCGTDNPLYGVRCSICGKELLKGE